MTIQLHKPLSVFSGKVLLPGSKSISNRMLLIKALSGLNFELNNCSVSDDTQHLINALEQIKRAESGVIDVGHAGTDLRFLTAYLATQPGQYELTGSPRLQQRPVKDLVDALNTLGADIMYKRKEGYPPLLIKGKPLAGGEVSINGNISSQFITALLLIAPYFKDGIKLNITGKLVSKPYVNMTVELMKTFGIPVNWTDAVIEVKPGFYQYSKNTFIVESDWSAASYFYSLIALSPAGSQLTLQGLSEQSLQADSACAGIFKNLGVQTALVENGIDITKTTSELIPGFQYNFIDCPDIAQTLVATCIGLKQSFAFSGLQTLVIKETDRIKALQTEAEKLGEKLHITENSIHYTAAQNTQAIPGIHIDTYNDHRMAMSFAPLCLVYNSLMIHDAGVVSKSYPQFWETLAAIGVGVKPFM